MFHSWHMGRQNVHAIIILLADDSDSTHSGFCPFSWHSQNALHAQVNSTRLSPCWLHTAVLRLHGRLYIIQQPSAANMACEQPENCQAGRHVGHC